MKIVSTKKALISSLFSFSLLTGTMVLGGTFAWFTSQAKNEGNVIKAGELKVALYNEDGTAPFFSSSKVWEPSDIETKTLKVVNEGTIDAVYAITLDGLVDNSTNNMLELFYVYVDDVYRGTLKNYVSGSVSESLHIGRLMASEIQNIDLKIEFSEDAVNDGREYSEINFDIIIDATQIKNSNSNYTLLNAPIKPDRENKVSSNDTEVVIPAGTFDNETTLNLTSVVTVSETQNEGEAIADIDLTLTDDQGNVIETFNGQAVTVTLYIQKGLQNVRVIYDGEGIQPTDVFYDPVTGKLTFTTTHFSRFIIYIPGAVIVKNDLELAAALAKPTLETIVLQEGTYSQNITIKHPVKLIGEDFENSPIITGKVLVTGNDAVMQNIHILHTYVETHLENGFPSSSEETLFKVTGKNFTFISCVLERATTVFRPYGWIIEYTKNEGKLTAIDTRFIAPTPTLDPATGGNPTPSVIGMAYATGISEARFVMDGGAIETNGLGLFSPWCHYVSLNNVTFKGTNQVRGDDSSYYGIFNAINSMDLDQAEITNCVFKENYSTAFLASGNFTLTDSHFENPWVANALYLALYSNNGDVVIARNNFKLTGIYGDESGSQQHYGIRLNSASWARTTFDVTRVFIDDNVFSRGGIYALRHDNVNWYSTGTLVLNRNVFNDNIIMLDSGNNAQIVIN